MNLGCTTDEAAKIAREFDLPQPFDCIPFPGKGNIHGDTFLVIAGGSGKEDILQRINQLVFTPPHSVMAAMMACIDSQRTYIAQHRPSPDSDWHPITLVRTANGDSVL